MHEVLLEGKLDEEEHEMNFRIVCLCTAEHYWKNEQIACLKKEVNSKIADDHDD